MAKRCATIETVVKQRLEPENIYILLEEFCIIKSVTSVHKGLGEVP